MRPTFVDEIALCRVRGERDVRLVRVAKLLALAGLGISKAAATDLPASLVKAPAAQAFDWNGFYVGGHFSYATGSSNWAATQAGAPSLTGSLDFFNSYDSFKGTGSYFLGLQAGYNMMLPSRVLLGAEADFSGAGFPAGVADTQLFSSPAAGQGSYGETVLDSGTVRARIGYVFNNGWLAYGTGGFAWTYDQLTRTQIAGAPVGGSALPGTVEQQYLWRLGWSVGGGVEVPVTPKWTAKVEYLLTDFGSSSVTFPAGAQQFNSDMLMQSVRLGLNYHLGDDTAAFLRDGPSALDADTFNLHGQTTFVSQYVFPFRSPYSGTNSLAPNSGRETWDLTFYAGMRLWEGAELWFNPEMDQGFGLSDSVGAAGFPSAEAFKVGFSYPYARIPRLFVRQTIDLGGETQKVDAGINQFAGSQTANRLVITVGKFAPTDIFDANKYAHDARNDFLNWTLGDTGTYDYAADAWAYTYGGVAEWYWGDWTLRGGVFDMSAAPNTTNLDPTFQQFQLDGEIEHRHELWGQPGKLTLTGFLTRGRMGRFDDAVALALATGTTPSTAAVRQYTSRPGMAFNMEQQIRDGIGAFVRAGVADGAVEPYEFTDVDRTVAGGFSFSGSLWGRKDDTLGLAGIVNGISSAHREYLNLGGLGILVGDGMLPHYGPEQILETYYSLPLFSWHATLDYQFINHPAYNTDRGPASVIATRFHTQF
jgi:high affinity Mn2+ porin